jgi:hypothetical protein
MDAQLNSDLVAYAREFKQHWTKTRDSIFAACDVLVRVKSKFPNEWENFKDMLPVHDGVLKKLELIGKHRDRLRKPHIYNRLPSSYSIIYEITQLKDEEDLEAALKEGQISTRMHRDAFIKWRDERRKGHRGAALPELNGLRVCALGLSPFATLHSSERTLSSRKALELKQELDAIAKRYGLLVKYAGCEALKQARAETIDKLQQRLKRLLGPYNAHLDQAELDLIENGIWQHRALKDGKARYRPECSNSIENQSHRYSIHDGWDYERLLSEANRRRIITSWTPIEAKEELGEAKCLQLAICCLHANDAAKHEKALKKIARANSKHSKFAEWCLQQIAPLKGAGLP